MADDDNTKLDERRAFLKTAALVSLAIGGLGFMREVTAATDTSEWITVTATLTLNPEHTDAAIAGLKDMVRAVEANEPGVLAYICNRSVEDPNEIMFFEIYENAAATQTHGQTPHMQTFRESAAAYFVGNMRIARYQQLEGYHR